MSLLREAIEPQPFTSGASHPGEKAGAVARFIGPPMSPGSFPLVEGPAIFLGAHFDVDHYTDALYPALGVEFPSSLHQAVKKRKAEFLAGRYLAQFAVARLSGRLTSISIGRNRQPLWPKGIVGSISHVDDYAACAVAADAGLSIGIDVEKLLSQARCEMIGRQWALRGERERLRQVDIPFATALTLLFSAKESLFKALYPRVGHYFGFSSAFLQMVDLGTGALTLALTHDLGPQYRCGTLFNLQFRIGEEEVLTCCVTGD